MIKEEGNRWPLYYDIKNKGTTLNLKMRVA